MAPKKVKKNPQADILEKIEQFEKHLKKLRQQISRGEVTSENYFAINKSAFLIDTLMWDYLRAPKKT